MKIKLDYQKIKDHLDDETAELFREFIDRVVASELFAGSDPEPYDLIDIKVNIEIEAEAEAEDVIRLSDYSEFDDEEDDWRDSPFNDFSDDDIDNIYRD